MSVSKIPDFGSSEYHSLVDNLIKGTCIFLGAGVSKLAGYRLWTELCDGIIDAFWEERHKLRNVNKDFTYSTKESLKNKKQENPIQVLDYLYLTDRKLFENALENIFEKDRKKEKTKVYEELTPLVRPGKNVFVQTNIDKSFQRFFRIQDNDVSINPYFSKGPKTLNYLHGRIDKKKTWVFTSNQYFMNYLDENSQTFNFLVDLFKANNVLFIGYSFRDFEVKQAIWKSRSSSGGKKHFLLVEYDELKREVLEINEINYRETYGIYFIKYNIENDGPELLLDVIKELSNTAVEL